MSFTIAGPRRKETATPKAGAVDEIAVAVVRWSGGNQTAERRGGPDMRTGPPNAIRS